MSQPYQIERTQSDYNIKLITLSKITFSGVNCVGSFTWMSNADPVETRVLFFLLSFIGSQDLTILKKTKNKKLEFVCKYKLQIF
jgi:hypothetical protein